jgi:hypothetical protein
MPKTSTVQIPSRINPSRLITVEAPTGGQTIFPPDPKPAIARPTPAPQNAPLDGGEVVQPSPSAPAAEVVVK